MDIQSLLQTLQDTTLATLIRESDSGFPALESLHVIGIALVLGTIVVVDLRLLGIAAHRPGALRLIKEMLPFTWVAFVTCVVTGVLMFMANATTYAQNPMFLGKMGLLALALSLIHI